MKYLKIATLLAVIHISIAGTAQTLMSKHGEPILPQAKDWSIGFDATKLIKTATFEFLSGSQAITGKYFVDSATAYRAALRLGVNTWNNRSKVDDRVARSNSVIAYPAPVAQKQNSWNRTSINVGFLAGLEKRKGRTRLQGIYGVEGGIFFSYTRDAFNYGNALNASPLSPVNVDDKDDAMNSPLLGNANNIDSTPPIQNVLANHARVLERSSGLTFAISARGFLGAEFFFLPKMSVGGEFGWGISYVLQGRSETRYESVGQSNVQGSTTSAVKQTTVEGAGGESFHLDSDNGLLFGGPSASLKISLYF
jgi:hypothetical protein